MSEAKVVITAQDNASTVIDNVTRRLGLFSKAGIGIGLTMAVANKAIDLVGQAFQDYISNIKEGIDKSREFDLNMARLANTVNSITITALDDMKASLKDLSVAFGFDLNTLATNMRIFTRTGYTTAEALSLMQEASLLATATGDDLDVTMSTIGRTLQIFNLDAEDSVYVIKRLADLYGSTGMTIDEVNRLLGTNASEIRNAGASFKDVTNILYNLGTTGSNTKDVMQQLKDILDTFPGATTPEMPTGAGLQDQLGRITATKSFTDAQLKALSGISQMDLGTGWDKLLSQFSTQKITDAKKYFDMLNTDGIGTLEDFNTETGMATLKSFNFDFALIGLDSTVVQLIRSMYMYNDLVTKIEESTAASALKDQENAIISMTERMNLLNTSNITYLDEISDLTAQQNYVSMTRSVTLEILTQSDAIDRLRHISDMYNLEMMGHNLEILKIQYGAGRRGLSRGQQRQIDIIERENLGLRIKEIEQQHAIGSIQVNNLYGLNQELTQIQRGYDTYNYANQLQQLKDFLKEKKRLIKENAAEIARIESKLGLGTTGVTIPDWKWNESVGSQLAREASQRRGIYKRR